jgi:UTP-glucose-1-phosphate uridylyltransferase
MNTGTTLVTMAAGSSSRYGAPKQLETFGKHGLTIAEYNALDAISAGFTNFVFIIDEQMADVFHRRLANLLPSGCTFSLVYQRREKELCKYCNRTKPWGTGHAVLSAKQAVHGNFGLVNADDLYGSNAMKVLANFLEAADASSATFVNVGYGVADTLSSTGTVPRGVMSVDGDGNLIKITERSVSCGDGASSSGIDRSALVSMNLWGFTMKIFAALGKQWAKFTESITNPTLDEFFLPSAIDAMVQNGECRVKVLRTSSRWHGITYPEDRCKLEKYFQET